MVQSIIDLPDNEDRILNIVKAQQGFKNKSQAIAFITKAYGDSFLEPEVKPEYIARLKKIEEEGYEETFSSIGELKAKIESS